MHKTLIVAKREYTKTVKKASFWISTLLFPILIVIIGVISVLSSGQIEQSIKDIQDKVKVVLIKDDSGILDPNIINELGFQLTTEYAESIEKVKKGEVSAFLFYDKDLVDNGKVEIYAQDLGTFGNSAFSEISEQLVRGSVLMKIPLELNKALNLQYDYKSVNYINGEIADTGIEKFIVPAIAVIIYFVLTMFATGHLLQSVSEEKENRAIEIVLSAIKPNELILGKIIGLVGVVLTQVLFLAIFFVLALVVFQNNISLPINLSLIKLDLGQILMAIFYAFFSFITIAATMVGVGAAMPNYKDANSYSAIFIMLATAPLYFVSAIVASPNGTVSVALSYIPFANGIVLLFRSTLGALTPLELIVSALTVILYTSIAIFMAFKLFEYGSLEYGKKISAKEFSRSLRKKKLNKS